jgi:ferredoxin-NADP reductase
LHEELDQVLGKNAHYIITDAKKKKIRKKYIDKDFLTSEIQNFNKPFYVCGPDKMITEINKILTELGADPESVVFEK